MSRGCWTAGWVGWVLWLPLLTGPSHAGWQLALRFQGPMLLFLNRTHFPSGLGLYWYMPPHQLGVSRCQQQVFTPYHQVLGHCQPPCVNGETKASRNTRIALAGEGELATRLSQTEGSRKCHPRTGQSRLRPAGQCQG